MGSIKKHANLSGFTIVELLIVIVVIAILAAITIVAYNGVQRRAITSALQSNLGQMATKLELAKTDTETYPETLTSAGLTTPSGSSFIYQRSATAYCLSGTTNTISYRISSSSTTPVEGSCTGILSNGVACPAGYIVVPSNSTLGSPEFCLMKYEAKNVGGVATSQAATPPWASISQTTALSTSTAACSGCHLMSENEWMAVAANILSVPSNWLNGTIGNSDFYRGHSDGIPANTLAASESDTDGYSGTENSGDRQRRTHTLTNGEVIWDLSGNVWEWTQGTVGSGQQPGIPGEATYAYKQWNNASLAWNNFPASSRHVSLASIPELSNIGSWSASAQSIGQVYSYYGETGTRAIRRGGNWSDGSSAGIFALGLNNTPSITSTSIGFRVAR